MTFIWQPLATGNINTMQSLVNKYPWWSAARIAMARADKEVMSSDPETRLVAMLHPTALIERHSIDLERLTKLSTEDLIDRFLKLDEYRIVASEGAAEDLSAVEISEEDELVSEEIAEIYEKQGLYSEAIDTYRKLSLLNSEKSIYFAERISKIEDKIKK